MHVEGNRSSGTSRNYRANAALPPRSVLIHLHALLPPPHYGARSPRPSLSFGNECASPVAASAGDEIMVKFDRLAAVARAGQTATPRRRGKERYGWMGWGRRGEGEHSFTSPFPRTLRTRTDPAPPPAPELVYLPGQKQPGRLLAGELIWSQKSPFPIFSCRRVTSSNA